MELERLPSEFLGFLTEKGPEARPLGMMMSKSTPMVGGLGGAASAMAFGVAGAGWVVREAR